MSSRRRLNGIDLHIILDPDQPDICIENPPGESDVGFVLLQDDSELSLASSTFVDNEASFEVQWIDDTRVDIVDTIFHDSTASSHTPSTDALYCNTTVASTADHVNGYGYLHGDGIGPFIGGVTVWNTAGWPCDHALVALPLRKRVVPGPAHRHVVVRRQQVDRLEG